MATGFSRDVQFPLSINTDDDETTPLLRQDETDDQQDIFFEELFRENCNISAEETEISFIQENVECFVENVITKVLNSEKYQQYIQRVDKRALQRLSNTYEKDRLLKVGSFYEETKNNYPDEFDFIFIVGECEYTDIRHIRKVTSDLSDIFHEQLKTFSEEPSTERETLLSWHYAGLHGPASKVQLVFIEPDNVRNRVISVDISVASKVHFKSGALPGGLNVLHADWKQMLIETGSLLAIKVFKIDHPKHETDVRFAITETEQRFVRQKMSQHQRHIYRLLKYVFNGNQGTNDDIRKLIRRPDNKLTKLVKYYWGKKVHGPRIVYDIPSYTIKTFVFHHVHVCQKPECSVPECLKEVLKHVLAVFEKEIDAYTTVWQDRLGRRPFTVSIETMLGQPLEIADDYLSAAITAKKLSDLIKSLEKTGDNREEIRRQIPFTDQNVSVVKSTLEQRGKNKTCTRCRLVTWLLMAIVFFIVFFTADIIVGRKMIEACFSESDIPKDIGIYTEYCCNGAYNHDLDWVNVTCSNYDLSGDLQKIINLGDFLDSARNHEESVQTTTSLPANAQTKAEGTNEMQFTKRDTDNHQTTPDDSDTLQEVTGNSMAEMEWMFASMASTLAQKCENNSKSETRTEFYLSCNLTGKWSSTGLDVFVIANLAKDCPSLISSCNMPEHAPFLKVTIATSDEKADLDYYFCVANDNCSTDSMDTTPLKTCTKSRTMEGTRTEICCDYTNIGEDYDCEYYKAVKNFLLMIRTILILCVFVLPGFITLIKNKRAIIRYVKRLRETT